MTRGVGAWSDVQGKAVGEAQRGTERWLHYLWDILAA